MLTYWRMRKGKRGSANSDSIRTGPKVKQDSDTVRENAECVFGVYVFVRMCVYVRVLVWVCFLSLVHAGYMDNIWTQRANQKEAVTHAPGPPADKRPLLTETVNMLHLLTFCLVGHSYTKIEMTECCGLNGCALSRFLCWNLNLQVAWRCGPFVEVWNMKGLYLYDQN